MGRKRAIENVNDLVNLNVNLNLELTASTRSLFSRIQVSQSRGRRGRVRLRLRLETKSEHQEGRPHRISRSVLPATLSASLSTQTRSRDTSDGQADRAWVETVVFDVLEHKHKHKLLTVENTNSNNVE